MLLVQNHEEYRVKDMFSDSSLLKRFNYLNKTSCEDVAFYSTDEQLKELKGCYEYYCIYYYENTEEVQLSREAGYRCCFVADNLESVDAAIKKEILKDPSLGVPRECSRFSENGYEVTTRGDCRYSPFGIKYHLKYTIEDYYHLMIKGLRRLGAETWADCKGVPPLIVEMQDTPWTRESVRNDPESLYIFTDNLLRTSGRNKVDSESTYAKYYSEGETLYYPNSSQAVIRGLENAFPITTMKDCYLTQLSDEEWDANCKNWYDEFDRISSAYLQGKFKRIVVSSSQFGNGKYSKMNEVAPISFLTLHDLLLRVLGVINTNPVRIDPDVAPRDLEKMFKVLYLDWFRKYPSMLFELLLLTKGKVLTDMFWVEGRGSQAKTLCEILNEVLGSK